MKIEISNVVVGDRVRKDFGDLNKLADSIADIGLLQPIGVTEDNVLVFGERRLRAYRDILGLTEIECRVIDMPNIVVGENAENEIRKDFTPSERVAIARAIADEMGDRRGVNQHTVEGPHNDAEAEKGMETRDFAAKRAGFGSRESFRRAEHVVENAEPELVEAMDQNVVSISAAHRASQLEPERQREIAKTGKTSREMDAELEAERRRRKSSQHPMLRVQTIISAVTDIRDCEMSPAEFQRLSRGPGLERFHRSAKAALIFLKAVVEVSDDKTRAG